MKNRITKNEEKLDKVLSSVKELESSLEKFESVLTDLKDVNKYYGSKSWFKDKDDYEQGKIEKVKAGVLSEDAVWNLNEKINEISLQMEDIIKQIRKK